MGFAPHKKNLLELLFLRQKNDYLSFIYMYVTSLKKNDT